MSKLLSGFQDHAHYPPSIGRPISTPTLQLIGLSTSLQRPYILVLYSSFKSKVLSKLHSSDTMGHFGFYKKYDMIIKSSLFWEGMKKTSSPSWWKVILSNETKVK
jgi:hypothetical protein